MFAGRKAVFHNQNKMREKNALIIQEIQFKNELVNSLNFNNLAKIKIPNIHDKTNDVWLWVIQCVYQESTAQYWWDNFKKQIFTSDGGVDYKNRLLGHDRRAFGEKEGFLTDKLLEDEQVILSHFKQAGNSDSDESFKNHFVIAKHMKNIYEHYQSL